MTDSILEKLNGAFSVEGELFRHNQTSIIFMYKPKMPGMLGISSNALTHFENELSARGEHILFPRELIIQRPVELPELLIAVEPVNALLAKTFLTDDIERPEFTNWEIDSQPAYFSIDKALQFCEKFGFQLPNTNEIEVHSRASEDYIFDFGDLPSDEALIEATLVPKLGYSVCSDRLRATCYAHWTASKSIENSERILRGGAAELWPWQDTGEWQLAVSCVYWPQSKGFLEAAVVRPVVYL
jgi:hypothetical protein